MTEYGPSLSAGEVLALFAELSDRLENRGVQAQLFVVGGAAMALVYNHGRVTRDVDALFVPTPEVRQIAEEISSAHGLEPDWLNDAVKGFLPGDDAQPVTVFESTSLLVQVPSAEYLLAMKLVASRDERDLDDAATLFDRLGYSSAQQCIDLLTSMYPGSQLLPRHRYIADEVADRATSRREGHVGTAPSQPETTRARRTARRRERSTSVDRSLNPPRREPPSGPSLGL